jgi:hypothetical protein
VSIRAREYIRLDELAEALERAWAGRLGRNMAVVGALFAAFRAGDNFGFHMGSDETQCTCQWSPCSGLPYRGSTVCEQEHMYEADERYHVCNYGDE